MSAWWNSQVNGRKSFTAIMRKIVPSWSLAYLINDNCVWDNYIYIKSVNMLNEWVTKQAHRIDTATVTDVTFI